MKKVINGKIYNTETADFIAQWENDYYRNDFNYCSEDLYRTKKGQYFIHGEGGALSKYSASAGNSSWGTSDITLLTEKEALEWCEEHDLIDAIEEHFSAQIEEG